MDSHCCTKAILEPADFDSLGGVLPYRSRIVDAVIGEGVGDFPALSPVAPRASGKTGRLTRALRATAFHMRAPERFLLVGPCPLAGGARERVLSADNWFVTHGDSDIDRP